MQESADTLRKGQKGLDSTRQADTQQQIARDLDAAADVLQANASAKGRSEDLSQALTRARQLREKLDAMTSELQKPGTSGQRSRLRDDAARELQRARELIDEVRRQDPSLSSGGPGLTFEGRGMTFSSPGTEGFKQDFSKWETLREQATSALSRLESSLAKRLQDQQSAERLAAGIDDKAPEAYRSRVDDYFKAIAAKKGP
jgi:DNA polymerase III delta prime subunit